MRIAAVLLLVSCGGPSSIRPDVTKLDDTTRWNLTNLESHAAAVEDGKQVLRLVPVGGNRKGSNVGIALVAGMTFTEGAIDIDLRGEGETASFLGIAFGAADPSHYEAVYFRPFRFRSSDTVERSHAVQYVAWPEHTWEALREQSPGVYEAPIAPVPDPAGWFHARVELGRTTVKVFVDHATQPTLVVTRLRNTGGGVGLWVDSQPGSFANLQIHATP